MDVVKRKKKLGTVTGTFAARGENFISSSVDALVMTYDGIEGDVHAGPLRKSGAREPWYERGLDMRNERQISLLAADELKTVAADMKIPELRAEWLGGNIVIEGIPHFSLLPPRTVLIFDGGVTIRIDGDNAPCRVAGRAIAEQFEDRDDLEFVFPKTALYRRGLVGWVEREGVITRGEAVTAYIWPQWIYPG